MKVGKVHRVYLFIPGGSAESAYVPCVDKGIVSRFFRVGKNDPKTVPTSES